MKLLSAGVLSATLTVGLVGSVAAYRSQVGDGGEVDQPTVAAATPAPSADRPEPRVRWAPCPAGSTLEGGACVTEVVRTHVLPAPATAPASAPATAPSRAPLVAPRDDSGYDDDDDERDDHGEGREDDDHEDDHEDDEDDEDDEDEDEQDEDD